MNTIHATKDFWEHDSSLGIREDNRRDPPWELIEDPTDSMIIGGRFYYEDIREQWSKRIWECWSPGMKFRNVKTEKVLLVYEKVTHKQVRDKIVEIRELLCKEIKKSDQLEMEM